MAKKFCHTDRGKLNLIALKKLLNQQNDNFFSCTIEMYKNDAMFYILRS